jgi:hypothetical protein
LKEVAILGCGPAGLLAAWATELSGFRPVIFSRKVKSIMPGAIYMHEPVGSLTPGEPDTEIRFAKLGSREGYARKVYKDPLAPCSWDLFPEGVRPGWDLKKVYDWLWERYQRQIRDAMFGYSAVRTLAMEYPLVLSTVPATALCRGGCVHRFNYARVWIRFRENDSTDGDSITYSGDPRDAWYRSSQLFGWRAQEYGHSIADAIEGKKPIDTNCNCCETVIRLGRFGKWKKGVLVTDAYREAIDALQSLQ